MFIHFYFSFPDNYLKNKFTFCCCIQERYVVKCSRASFRPCTNKFFFCLSTHPFFHLSIHPSIILNLMHSMKHELVSFRCPALRKRRNKWKKVKEVKEEVSKIFKLLVVVWYGMNCLIGAQMLCCKDSGVYVFIVHCVCFSLLPLYGLVFSTLRTNIWDHKHCCSHFRWFHCLRQRLTGHLNEFVKLEI